MDYTDYSDDELFNIVSLFEDVPAWENTIQEIATELNKRGWC